MASLPGQIFDFEVTDSTLIGMLQKINSFTDVGQGGVLGIFILIVVGGGLLLMMRSAGNERAFSVAALVTSLIGVFLRILGLIGDAVFWICIAMFLVSIVSIIKEQSKFE